MKNARIQEPGQEAEQENGHNHGLQLRILNYPRRGNGKKNSSTGHHAAPRTSTQDCKFNKKLNLLGHCDAYFPLGSHLFMAFIHFRPLSNQSQPLGETVFAAISRFADKVIGLTGHRPELIQRMRSDQVNSIVRLTPAMTIGNLVCTVATTANFYRQNDGIAVAIWAVLNTAIALMGLRAWLIQRKRTDRRRASPRVFHRAVIHALILGCLWGSMPLMAYEINDSAQKLLVATIVAGILSAGGFAFAPLPQAALAFLAPVTIGSAVALLQSPSPAEWMLAFLQVVYTGIIVAASLGHARIFVANLQSEFEALEQRQVVGMLLKSFEENASDWLWQVDHRGHFARVSLRFSEVTGLAPDRLDGASALALLRMIAGSSTAFMEVYLSFKGEVPFRDIEIRLDRNGEAQWWKITGEPIYDDFGLFAGFHGVCSDITEAKLAAGRVAYLAHHDSLTGALNRARFNEELTEAIIDYEFSNTQFSLFYLDLDRFKAVNDTMGHQTGDALLIEVVRRLEVLMPSGCLLARLGGDEFCVLIEGDCSEERLGDLAEKIIESICTPFQIEDKIAKVGTSIGIALASNGAGTAEMLHHQADLALYAAKQGGRGTFRFYTEDMDSAEREVRELEADLAHAVTRGELELHFQPIVCSGSTDIVGFEALARWRHPTKGMIPPLHFIPLAEKKGLIGEIGLFVLNEACRVAATWPRHFTVAVNLSSRQFATHRVARDVRLALEKSGLSPEQLELELTESILIEQPETVIETLKELKAIGVKIALDDFGTGYSSLSYLWRFPFDKIKIDGSFVAAINRDQGARHILSSMGALARNLGFKLTAERVETAEEVAFLQGIACDYLQGYFFSKPLPESDLAPCLAKQVVRIASPEAKIVLSTRRRPGARG
jgi:diguanylate cyclase (GGDEF)-like protein/PAS domain S-box-containing protein